jgi:hypothetical protein
LQKKQAPSEHKNIELTVKQHFIAISSIVILTTVLGCFSVWNTLRMDWYKKTMAAINGGKKAGLDIKTKTENIIQAFDNTSKKAITKDDQVYAFMKAFSLTRNVTVFKKLTPLTLVDLCLPDIYDREIGAEVIRRLNNLPSVTTVLKTGVEIKIPYVH